MRLFQSFTPIFSLALVVNCSSPVSSGSNNGVKISKNTVEEVQDLNANGSEGDVKGAVNGVREFFKDNASILTSFFKVLKDPKHSEAEDSIHKEGFQLYNDFLENPGSNTIKLKSIDYVYKHPEILDLAGAIVKQVADDHPTLVKNGFEALEREAAKNPKVFKNIIAIAITFSNEQEAAFEKIVEMALKFLLHNVKLSAQITEKALKLDQLICACESSANCDCKAGSTFKKPVVESPAEPTSEPKAVHEKA